MILDNVPKTYNDLQAWLEAHPRRTVIQGNITVQQWGDEIQFYLYSTPIVVYRPHSVIFSTGGWQTMTTRRWINSLKPTEIRFVYHEHLKDTWMMSDGKHVSLCRGTVWETPDWQNFEPYSRVMDMMKLEAKQTIQNIDEGKTEFFTHSTQSMYGIPNVKRPTTLKKYLTEWLEWVA